MSDPTSVALRHLGLASLVLLLAACTSSPGESPAATTSSAPATSSESAEPSEAASADATVVVAETELGQILTDADGRTIYFFANDEAGTSTCEGGCNEDWPPVEADRAPEAGEGVTAEVGTLERSDGTSQLTINDFPAYYFADDRAAGDTNGQGVGGVWWVVGPAGEPIEE